MGYLILVEGFAEDTAAQSLDWSGFMATKWPKSLLKAVKDTPLSRLVRLHSAVPQNLIFNQS